MSELQGGIGQPINRLDGRLKVTGEARYAGDWPAEKLAHGVLVQSTIASGKIRDFDLRDAKKIPGVIEILTYENAPKLKKPKGQAGSGMGESFPPFQDQNIHYNGQYIALVVAETLTGALQAANLVKARYKEESPRLDLKGLESSAYVIKTMPNMGAINLETGNTKKGFEQSEAVIEATYTTPIENHNPMEPSATMASLSGTEFTAYDATQGVHTAAGMFADALGIPHDKSQVITRFVGGGFGCKGSMWPHQLAALMATKKVGRPVRVVVTREQMFTGVGHRAETIQHIKLGAKKDGTLMAIEHQAINNTAMNKDFSERSTTPSQMLYKCENIKAIHKLVKTNYQSPTFMRAPGESSGSFALECAMDELAEKLKIDPIELRLKNYTDVDQKEKKPFSGKALRECYAQGAKVFGWEQRKSQPRSLIHGDDYVGFGMATATYPAKRFAASAKIEFFVDGTVGVSSATQDIGTGSWTVLPQIAAQYLDLDLSKIKFDLGDSRLAAAGVSGGSTTLASVGSAIKDGCDELKKKLIKLAVHDQASPLYKANADKIELAQGRLQSMGASENVSELLKRNQLPSVSVTGQTGKEDTESKKYAGHSFGAQFAEVRVHKRTGEVRVSRCLGAFACGKIINPKTAKSQFMGGMIFGLGMALMEKTQADLNTGRLVVKDLADYHVPIQADVPELEILMIETPDTHVNPIGAKGVGEIGIVGAAAAIANAVYNATGVRVRDLPILPEKLAIPLLSLS